MPQSFSKNSLPKLTENYIKERILPDLNYINSDDKKDWRKREEEQRKHFYLESYPAILSVTRNQALDEETRRQALAAMTYGWMPTIPKMVSLDLAIDKVAMIASHKDARIFIQNLEKRIINNSWVGTSKMLHFINPAHFPIWDSRIAKNLCEQNGKVVNANNKNRYLSYCELVHDWHDQNPAYGNY